MEVGLGLGKKNAEKPARQGFRTKPRQRARGKQPSAMLRRVLLLGLLTALPLAAQSDLPAVPSVRFDLLPGGRTNVVVEQKAFPMESAKAAELKAKLDALDLPGIRADVSKLRDALRTEAKSEAEAELKAKSLERESGRVKEAEGQVASLEKRKASLEDQIRRAQRAKADNLETLRGQLNSLNATLGKERKDLVRAKELQEKAKAAKGAAESEGKSATRKAEELGKSIRQRLAKVEAVLREFGVG